MPEELKKHLIPNSNRLRTFEDARLEVVTYVEAKFGLRIRDAESGDAGSRGRSDPSEVDAVNSLSSSKGKGSSSPRDSCFHVRGHFQRDCQLSKSWSKSEGKGKSRDNKGKTEGTSKGVKGAKGFNKGKSSIIGLSGLEHPRSETNSEIQDIAQTYPTDNSYTDKSWCDDVWSYVQWNDDWSSVGWHEGWNQTYDNSESSFPLGSFDLGAISSPQRF